MSGTNHTNQQAQRAKILRNGFFLLAVLSLSVNVLQQINFSRSIGKDRTILKSQFIGDNCIAWVNNFEASKCYLEGLAFGDTVTLMSLHPKNGKLVQDRMVARTHASYKSEMKRFIYEQVTKIREKEYSFSYYPTDVLADSRTNTVYVTGVLNPKIGSVDLDPEEITWGIRYTLVNGEAMISNFFEYNRKG
ncbi:TraE/TraK family type IV conjugative transfer system protein [Vibrio mediterranei]|uniref:Uncharacterized protein n=1 Tax=Vibrio mediterranei TaxID=689 RepID=A0ABX5D929_9VIBR|nr:TraE/TraK family type IV conjugative transfer system protein [Vibrio mediterranei]MCG9658652.1 type IV conjugative transfer system protein TraE [Vibrio mediterranei]PRQ65171.1 hypothetical protein COR51_23915 [Vibrio mediterranei]